MTNERTEDEMSEAIDWKALEEPFPYADLEWRVQRDGSGSNGPWALVVPYVKATPLMARFDQVCGHDRWCNQFKGGPAGGVICGISIKVGAEWVTKWDGAENTGEEAVKGGLTVAFKRCARLWGPGRYLYDLGPFFATIVERGRFRVRKKDGSGYQWNPPAVTELPDWAVPLPPAAPPQKPQLSEVEVKKALGKLPPNVDWNQVKTYCEEHFRTDKLSQLTRQQVQHVGNWIREGMGAKAA